MLKTILICAAIIISTCIWRYYSPYQVFLRDCVYNDFLGGDFSKEYCTWKYKQLLQEDSWLKELLR